MTAVAAIPQKPNILFMPISLEEFKANLEFSYDDRWRWHDYRITTKDNLPHWIFDWHSTREKDQLAPDEVIEIAHAYLLELQARKGQINQHGVYMKGYEEIFVVEKNKKYDYASVSVVCDPLDGIWRYTTHHQVGNGGSGSGISFLYSARADSRNDAALKGAKEIQEAVMRNWEYKDSKETYLSFVRKIESFIELYENSIRQPSLF